MPQTPEAAVGPPNLRLGRLLGINAFWFASNLHWGVLLAIVLPSQMKLVAPGHDAEALGLVQGIGALIGLLVPPIAGALSDRSMSVFGRRRPFVVWGVAANLAGLGLLCYAGGSRSLWLYLAGFIAVQVGHNIAYGAYTGVIPDQVPPKQRGAASACMGILTVLGTAVGAVAAGYLMSRGLSIATYAMVAATLVLFVAITVAAVRETPRSGTGGRLKLGELAHALWISPRKHPQFAWVWLSRALVMLGVFVIQPFLQYYLRDVIRAADPEWATARLLAAIVPAGAAAAVLGGWASDRFGRYPVVYIAKALLVVAGTGFIFVSSLNQVVWVGLAFGAGYGAYYAANWAMGCDLLPGADTAARDMGIWNAAMMIPQSLGAVLTGLLLAAWRTGVTRSGDVTLVHYAPMGYRLVFTISVVSIVAGAVVLLKARQVAAQPPCRPSTGE